MANEEHVKRLKQGVVEWNEWRRDNPTRRINLSLADLSSAILRSADLTSANLSSANLSSTNLFGADLRGADLSSAVLNSANLGSADVSSANLRSAVLFGATLRGADLSLADLSSAFLRSADLTAANLSSANLRGANLGSAHLSANLGGADLSSAVLFGAHLRGADLSSANLHDAYLHGADLSYANLRGTNLSSAHLSSADLTSANLSSANLRGADLRGADLSSADLSSANLSSAFLFGAHLHGADLSLADLTEARLGNTVFADVDLTSVIGLETCKHQGPSVIDHRTLEKSKSKPLPLAFLRGVGLPDNLIEYLPSLFNQAIQHYSCFISHSSKDDEFAHRLHADLQNSGVRCWLAQRARDLPLRPDLALGPSVPHDLPIGAAILLWDKVVLILSEHSINSDWIEDQVTAAFEEERKRGQSVLFPVRLDEEVMNTNEAWAAKLRARNIGDFRKWKDHDAYKQSFERAVRDLTIPGVK
jgi:uncharacterized protein YjbI with pentapeptide repeats